MEGGHIPEVMLNSGFTMPIVGLGTGASPTPAPEVVYRAVLAAIETGYRHFDTAAFYESEEPLGKAIRDALDQGLVGSRDQLFVTSKLWAADAYPEGVLPALRKTLAKLQFEVVLLLDRKVLLLHIRKLLFLLLSFRLQIKPWAVLDLFSKLVGFRKLQLEYVDLYLIHLQLRLGDVNMKLNDIKLEAKPEVLPLDIAGTWAAMEECQRLGLAKSIGVSNFTCKKLADLLLTAEIPPAVNQVEMHPLWQQAKLRELCASNGIHVTAWSPLGGHGNEAWGTKAVLENPVLKEIAQSIGKTVAQTVPCRSV